MSGSLNWFCTNYVVDEKYMSAILVSQLKLMLQGFESKQGERNFNIFSKKLK